MDNFREWVSDNLRYILLILLIAVLALLCFFGLRYLKGREDSRSSDVPEQEETAVSVEDTETPAPAAEETDAPSVTEEETETAEEEEDPAAARVFLESVPSGVKEAVEGYFAAAGKADSAAMIPYVDELSDSDASSVDEGVPMTYSDIEVYCKPGVDGSGYLAYVSYLYQAEEDPSPLPGLSVFYVIDKDGRYVVKTTPLTADEENLMNEAEMDADAQDLVARIRSSYVDALAEGAEEGNAD